jgi:hypothetical protein
MRRNLIASFVILAVCELCLIASLVLLATFEVVAAEPERPTPANTTAQGVAELMARSRQCKHFGGNRGYEGVGMGSTPEAALGNCCYSRSGMRIVDQGVAYAGGRWWACKRYR